MMIEGLHAQLVRSFLFPFSQYLYNRRGIRAEYRKSAAAEYWPEEKLSAFQIGKLNGVLEYAYRFVPYYQKLFDNIGIRPSDVKTVEDLSRIPALSREDVISHRLELVDRRYGTSLEAANSSKRGPAEPIPFARLKRRPLVRNTSSGSTGAPTVFYEDGTVSAVSWANELRVKRWYGIRPGQREARLVRVSPDYVFKSKANLFRRIVWNQMMLPGVNLSNEHYDLIVDHLSRFRPKVIWAFTSAAAGLARHIREHGQLHPPWAPSLIIPWAAPLYDHEREVIEQAFNCSISNIYGLREVGHIGSTCPAGSLHVFQETHLVERDQQGELIVTFLRPSPMPFIRYRTGDIGELTNEMCPCGRKLQVIKHLHGRTGEIYITPDGKMFSPNFWCRTFMDPRLASKVKRFQIIYEKNNRIHIKLVAGHADRIVVENMLRRTIDHNFGERMMARFEYVEDIAPQISGKYQMVIIEK
jgi:phenylacetate-CoA ligase